jgi:hypothetical protein
MQATWSQLVAVDVNTPAPTPPQGFSSLLDYAIAAEEQRVRVGWSGSAGSDDLAEDR